MSEELPDKLQLYRFKLDRILGSGGTGTVYRGIDTQNGQVVAVKLFHENFFNGKAHIRDFTKSVQHFREFNHPNVVKITEFCSGEKEGNCMVMEYVDGPDLRWYIENRPWNLQERCVIAAQICNGLQYIHDQGFTHHDLKPANIMFTRKGVVKLTDYSLSRERLFGFMSNLTDQVTPMFVAPEIIRKEKATPQSDIYSLGMTFYLFFTGLFPFATDNLQKLYQMHLRTMPEHPSVVSKRCPRAMGDIIMQMVAKEPTKRFESCDLLRIRLAEVGRSRI